MQLDGETILFPIIGDPIAQVRSPRYLTEILAARGVNAIVPPVHVHRDHVAATLESFRHLQNLRGVVVTIPHKIASIECCDVVSERARFVGSVNVIHKDAEGRLIGDNVDGYGYLDGIRALGFEVKDKCALLVGAGGAGSAVAYEILDRGAAHLSIADLDATRRDRIIAALDARFPGRVGPGSDDPTGMDLVANVTPCGMRAGDPFPADPAKMHAGQFVADAITRPEVSPMVAAARALGCKTMTGAGMFNAEAERLVDFLLGQGLPPYPAKEEEAA
ncbi:shikimate dehydrogenase [Pseudooceanicola sp. CBS1P-1]|uniref:shikimate dehydrogenase family protein n=1 Tax=Pseudooceanicola TaxID=1679449 RepID=UPI001C028A39|nr:MULTISPECIES: shikimate dehydrogenase [Pseudooceanicola]MBT9385660.1 shikimate dehydrogenase [Pseudooceanicola endophyticus]